MYMYIFYAFLLVLIVCCLIIFVGSYSIRKREYDANKRYELLYKDSLLVNDEVDDLDSNEYLNYTNASEDDENDEYIEEYLARRKKRRN